MLKLSFTSKTGFFASSLVSSLLFACGGVPAYPQPEVEESKDSVETPAFVAAQNALEADGFVCTPASTRSCVRFEASIGACVTRVQHCASDGSAWLACGADPRDSMVDRMFDEAPEDEDCAAFAGNVFIR